MWRSTERTVNGLVRGIHCYPTHVILGWDGAQGALCCQSSCAPVSGGRKAKQKASCVLPGFAVPVQQSVKQTHSLANIEPASASLQWESLLNNTRSLLNRKVVLPSLTASQTLLGHLRRWRKCWYCALSQKELGRWYCNRYFKRTSHLQLPMKILFLPKKSNLEKLSEDCFQSFFFQSLVFTSS